MKVLLAASEVAPIIKLGGLGDVVGSLPIALEKLGVNVDVIVPYFPIAVFTQKVYKAIVLDVPFNGQNNVVEVYKTKLPNSNVDVFLLKNEDYFIKGGTNAFANNINETEMFSFFSRSVVEFVKTEFNTYDIVHCNDWHTGLITHLLESELGQERPRTLFTIHNLMYQGVGESDLAREVGITPGEHPLVDWDLEDNKLNLMLQGVTSSDYISAVSPTYAKEILTEQFGGALADILKNREGRLTGILNGIDTNAFPRYYDVSDWQTGKVQARQSLLIKLGLKDNDKPIFSFISRLDPNQKGLDILLEVIPEIISRGGRFVLLGAGDRAWEQKFLTLAGEDVAIRIAFDNALACDIYAGSSFLLVPSRYEPCGLIQMIAMWYGTLPIVHNVGGLKDSVDNRVNGFVFDDYSGDSAKKSVKDAMKMYNSNSTDYGQMAVNAMKTDFSWGKSAKEYLKLYERMHGGL